MTVRERMLALRLLERTAKNSDYVKQIGLNAFMKCGDTETSKTNLSGYPSRLKRYAAGGENVC